MKLALLVDIHEYRQLYTFVASIFLVVKVVLLGEVAFNVVLRADNIGFSVVVAVRGLLSGTRGAIVDLLAVGNGAVLVTVLLEAAVVAGFVMVL